MDLISGKNVVVTGGVRGIGLAICQELLCRDIEKLCIIDICTDNKLIERIKNQYPKKLILFKKCDVSSKSDVEACFSSIKDLFEQIHIVCNCAGVFNDLNIGLTLSVNVGGVIHSSLAALNYMNKKNGGEGGCIINIASLCGLGPSYFAPIYTASKYAVLGFTRSMGLDYCFSTMGVKFMCICPGKTDTTMIDKLSERIIFNDLKIIVDSTMGINQNVECVSKCVVTALTSNRNNSVWICDCDKIIEVEPEELSCNMSTKNL